MKVLKQTKANELSAADVFISARIPSALNEELDQACLRSGMKKQAVVAMGLRKVIPGLMRRAI